MLVIAVNWETFVLVGRTIMDLNFVGFVVAEVVEVVVEDLQLEMKVHLKH